MEGGQRGWMLVGDVLLSVFPSVGVARGWITWNQTADCLLTADRTVEVAVMEMSNSCFCLSAVCVCGDKERVVWFTKA